MAIRCSEYRLEMILLGLRRRLSDASLSEDEKEKLLKEIRRMEAEMRM